jgi:D-sedoheptulose 7-phosphate isomerase
MVGKSLKGTEDVMTELDKLMERLPKLRACESDIQRAYEMLKGVFEDGGKLLLCGNGGSAADAEHWSGELLKSFVKARPANDAQRMALGDELADNLQRGLPAIPLTGFISLNTAYANDCNPPYVFAQLTYALARPGDALAGISTSGNSENVCLALRTARALGLKTIGLTGASGGRMHELCDICIRVPEQETYLIQELHLPVYHTLCLMLEDALF